jgi:hypothetical protein
MFTAPQIWRSRPILAAALVLGLIGTAAADESATATKVAAAPKDKNDDAANAQPADVEYRPPQRGAPETRIAGSTRGSEVDLHVAVLAPRATGWTAVAQPTLYWYMSRPVDRVEIVVAAEDAIDPLVDRTLDGPFRSGVHAAALAALGAELAPDVEYKWSVIGVLDEAQPSRNPVASGTIRRVAPPTALTAALAAATLKSRAALLAGHGYWYDALGVLAERRATDPAARAARAAMLEREGLTEVANAEAGGG